MTPTPEQIKIVEGRIAWCLESARRNAEDLGCEATAAKRREEAEALTALLATWRERGERVLTLESIAGEAGVADHTALIVLREDANRRCESASVALAKSQQEVEALRRQLEEAQAEVERWKGVATHRWELVKGMELAISVRDSEIDRLRVQLAERDRQLEEAQAFTVRVAVKLAERDKEVERLRGRLLTVTSEHVEMRSRIVARVGEKREGERYLIAFLNFIPDRCDEIAPLLRIREEQEGGER